jgi:hypothetical protein
MGGRLVADTLAGSRAVLSHDQEPARARAAAGRNGRASALAAVAEGLATSDPDRAERLAQSITSPAARALALAAVAKAVGSGVGTGRHGGDWPLRRCAALAKPQLANP